MDELTGLPLPQRRDARIGVLGSGFIVSDCHLVAYRKAGFNPVAIASRTRANAQRVADRHGIATTYDDFDQLLDDRTIEVLDVAVTPDAQASLIRAACERGTARGILAQKPLANDLAEARELVSACERAGIALAVNQNMRYDPSVRQAKRLLASGELGDAVFASIDMRAIPHLQAWQEAMGWVTLRIMSIHHLDCLRHWFGEPQRIYCSARPDPRTPFPHADGICTYVLEYASGLRCVGIDDIWTGPAREGCPSDIAIRYRIEGTRGLAMGEVGWCKDPYTSPSSVRHATIGDPSFADAKMAGSWFPDAFAGTMGQLLLALERGEAPAISGRDNLRTMALVEAAYRSVAEKRVVEMAEFEEFARA
jgi:predicted dehydrogenase